MFLLNGKPFLILFHIQPVSYKRYFRCNNCVLLLVHAINLSLSTDLVDPYGENTFSVKPPLSCGFLKYAWCIFIATQVRVYKLCIKTTYHNIKITY